LDTNNTWDLVSCPVGSNVVTDKRIFKNKFNSDDTLEWYKAHWVLRSFNQWSDVDYDETFNPVVNLVTIRTVLSLAISRSWAVHQLDVKNTFLHDTLLETVTSLFVFRCGTDTVYLLLYVYNIVLIASNITLLQHTISALKRTGSSSLSVSMLLISLSVLEWCTASQF
jgi:hypothetical protein